MMDYEELEKHMEMKLKPGSIAQRWAGMEKSMEATIWGFGFGVVSREWKTKWKSKSKMKWKLGFIIWFGAI